MKRINDFGRSPAFWIILAFIEVWLDATGGLICAATAVILSEIERPKA
jgi:hypothetical protein